MLIRGTGLLDWSLFCARADPVPYVLGLSRSPHETRVSILLPLHGIGNTPAERKRLANTGRLLVVAVLRETYLVECADIKVTPVALPRQW